MSADRYEWLATFKCNHFHLTKNEDHAVNYVTAKQWLEEVHDDLLDVPPEELQAMKDTNTIWSLQIYPDTPIGFHVWLGATLDGVIDRARLHFTTNGTLKDG